MIFRKTALERLASPEELDQTIRLTTPRSWLALLALGGLLLAGLLWSVIATIPTTVAGRGVLALGAAPAGPPAAVVFVSLDDARRIRPGMPVRVDLASVNKQAFGLAEGTVSAVDELPSDVAAMRQALGNDAFAQALAAAGALIRVQIVLQPDASTASGVRWTARGGPPTKLQSGMLCTGVVTISEQHPINLLIP